MIQALLDRITGRHVRFIGLVLAIVFGSLLTGSYRVGYLIAVALAALNWTFPVLAKSKTFSNFADPKFWPTFVLAGVAMLFAHGVPGWRGDLAIGVLLMVLDGMYFEQNY